MKAKRLLSLLLALAMMCSVAASFGCGAPAATATESTDTTDAAAKDPNAPDYDNMSMKELYDLAIQEKGVITIYSTTTTAQTAVKKFLKTYPEFEGRIEYIESDTNTVADRIETESDTGNINADLLQVKDNSG